MPPKASVVPLEDHQPTLTVCRSKEELCATATTLVLAALAKHDAHGTVALSGGSTPKVLYNYWREKHLASFKYTYFFFGDERLVPRTSSDSNFRMAFESLLQEVDSTHVHPINTSLSAEQSAEEYVKELERFVAKDRTDGVPSFDVVLLGVGTDGHYASLFKGSPASEEFTKWVTTSMPPNGVAPQVPRVTLSPLVLTHSKCTVVIVTGPEKKWVVEGILSPNPVSPSPVSRLLRGFRGPVHIICDPSAAPSATS